MQQNSSFFRIRSADGSGRADLMESCHVTQENLSDLQLFSFLDMPL